MDRTNIFVSYSHFDDLWENRLRMHLSVLKRKGLVDVWSDTNIKVGQRWEQEIESALTRANVAVLLVSAGFLASEYIWREEMPRIVRHAEAGMKVLPLIVRPCAWRLADQLARLQARPAGARPLSTGTEPQIDVDLADFVLELANMVNAVPAGMVNDQRELPLHVERRPGQGVDTVPKLNDFFGQLPRVWQGTYAASKLVLTLRITWDVGGLFTGTLDYDGDAVSEITGRIGRTASLMSADEGWDLIGPSTQIAMVFTRTAVVSGDHWHIQHTTEYRGFISNGTIRGAWRNEQNGLISLAQTTFTAVE